MSEEPKKKRTWTEEIEVEGRELVEKVKGWIGDSSATRIIIRKSSGDVLMEVPIVAGVAAGGVATFFAPILVALGAMAALLELVKVEIVHEEEEEEEKEEEKE